MGHDESGSLAFGAQDGFVGLGKLNGFQREGPRNLAPLFAPRRAIEDDDPGLVCADEGSNSS